jgi:hypothetical protein
MENSLWEDRTSDHILIEARHEISMVDVRGYRGENVVLDHYLVVTRITARINITKYYRSKAKVLRYDVSILQKPEIKKEYEERIQTFFTELDEKKIDSDDWACCEEIINKAAHEKVGKQRTIRGEGWFDQECAEIADERTKHIR